MQRLECAFEAKFAGDGQDMAFEGYGAVFGNVDSYGDVIDRGAFKSSLRESKSTGQWPAMLAQHGSMFGGAENMPIGVWTDLTEDDKGLKVEGRLADTPRGQEAYTLMKMQPRPAITGLSIGFVAKRWESRTRPEEPRRTLKEVRLLEVSLVTFPANEKARVTSVKTLAEFDPREMEEALRDAGLSQRDRKAAVAVFRDVMLRRDAGEPDTGSRDEAAAAELVALLNSAAARITAR